MKKIAFIAGPALGHVSRLYKAAIRLRSVLDVEITFVNASFGRFVEPVAGNDFEIVFIPISDEAKQYPVHEFASGLEHLFETTSFDLIVHDLCPLRWISTTRFPDCPRVNVTNVFLTQLARTPTSQVKRFDRFGESITRCRVNKGLSKPSSVYDFYEADRVLLADPLPLISTYGDLPDHYRACGPCSWSMEGQLPTELSDLKDALLLSMGSTGRRTVDAEFLKKACRLANCRSILYVGDKIDEMRQLGAIAHHYKWLPLDKLSDKVKVVISQGGAGSTYQALSLGVPVIILPTHLNHQILGELLEAMRLGICIQNNASFSKIDAFNFDELSANALALAGEMQQRHGADEIASQIAEFL